MMVVLILWCVDSDTDKVVYACATSCCACGVLEVVLVLLHTDSGTDVVVLLLVHVQLVVHWWWY